jgi:alkanesulfonate monooxygenase SsuD/methylene tetrahydromethanopterin reductase-like flavin-dependent oxidoreductase (luciferase family)
MKPSDCSLLLVTWGKSPATLDDLIEVATSAERLGFYSVGLPHQPVLLHPEDDPPPHWRFIPDRYRDWYLDSLVALPILIHTTTRIKIGMNILLAGWFHPFFSAKYLASLDVASGGRLITGFGLGYAPPGGVCTSFEHLGLDSSLRAQMCDDALAVIHKLWTESAPISFDGPHFKGVDLMVDPKPVQKPYPETWWAGQAHASIRRAARYAKYLELHRVLPSAIRDYYLPQLGDANVRYGGSAKIAVLLYANVLGDRTFPMDELAAHYWNWDMAQLASLAAGSSEQCASVLRRFREAGVQHFILDLHRHGEDHVSKVKEQMELFATEVLPLVER